MGASHRTCRTRAAQASGLRHAMNASFRASAGRQALALFAFVAVCLAIGAIGGAVTSTSVGTWYQQIRKPSFNPPDWVFGPVWTVLYIAMAVAAWRVWRRSAWATHGMPCRFLLSSSFSTLPGPFCSSGSDKSDWRWSRLLFCLPSSLPPLSLFGEGIAVRVCCSFLISGGSGSLPCSTFRFGASTRRTGRRGRLTMRQACAGVTK